jgi:molybdopterin synthase sulfur carrier subunit
MPESVSKKAAEPSAPPVKLKYFAWVREKVGRAEEDVVLPPDVVTVGELMAWQSRRGPHYAAAFAAGHRVVRAALDHRHVKPGAPIGSAREIAFFPPVTGG